MPDFSRTLSHQLPLLRGPDVKAVQRRLDTLDFSPGAKDGLYGHRTEMAVRDFQSARGLRVDGTVGPNTWSALFRGHGQRRIRRLLPELTKPHAFRDSVEWKLAPEGVLVNGDEEPEVWGGPPRTVREVWQDHGKSIREWGRRCGVPVELIVSTICTESDNDPSAVRREPGYESDAETPHRISAGLMQTLLSTAQSTLGTSQIDRHWLQTPDNSIRAGTSYMAEQWKQTHLDPPKVACAYNAGRIIYNASEENRWKMLQYPEGTSEHADRFVKWFNECVLMFEEDDLAPAHSYYAHVTDQVDGT